jgi:outer membrane protein assembly factor BamA
MKKLFNLIIVVPCLILIFNTFAEGGTFEMVAGGEGNDQQGYAFLMPSYRMAINNNYSVVLRASANYLQYEFEELGGTTEVSSPGADVGVSLRWSNNRLSLSAGPGYEIRETERTLANGEKQEDTEEGFNVVGSLFFQATPLTNISLMSSYSNANQYIWARAGVKRQITNKNFQGSKALFIGADVTGQGNDDTSVYHAGLVFEIAFFKERISLQLRSGYPVYQESSEDKQPYFGVGLYKSF